MSRAARARTGANPGFAMIGLLMRKHRFVDDLSCGTASGTGQTPRRAWAYAAITIGIPWVDRLVALRWIKQRSTLTAGRVMTWFRGSNPARSTSQFGLCASLARAAENCLMRVGLCQPTSTREQTNAAHRDDFRQFLCWWARRISSDEFGDCSTVRVHSSIKMHRGSVRRVVHADRASVRAHRLRGRPHHAPRRRGASPWSSFRAWCATI
jgi:hypothetical protein